MSERVVRKPFERVRTQSPVDPVSRTQQHFRDQVDVNQVVARWAKTGIVDHVAQRQPHYGDFSLFTSLSSALDQVEQLEDEFMQLDAHIREAADNSALRYLEMLGSQEGVTALEAAGLEFPDPDVPGQEPAPPEVGTPQGEPSPSQPPPAAPETE